MTLVQAAHGHGPLRPAVMTLPGPTGLAEALGGTEATGAAQISGPLSKMQSPLQAKESRTVQSHLQLKARLVTLLKAKARLTVKSPLRAKERLTVQSHLQVKARTKAKTRAKAKARSRTQSPLQTKEARLVMLLSLQAKARSPKQAPLQAKAKARLTTSQVRAGLT